MEAERRRGFLHLHLATLLFGGTAMFAKWITLPPEVTTFWRTIVALGLVWILCRFRGQSLQLGQRRDVWIQIGLGGIFGIHWATYYAAIQSSTVLIGVTALFTAPVLSVLINAVVARVRPDRIDLLLGGVVFVGVAFLSPDISWENRYTQGVIFGMISAFFLALRQVLHVRTRVRAASGLVLLLYQLIGISVLFAPVGLTSDMEAAKANGLLLLVLGAIFTALPHFLLLSSLRALEAKTVLIISSLMLPYSVVFGVLLLHEIPAPHTLLGCVLVLAAATVENLRVRPPEGGVGG